MSKKVDSILMRPRDRIHPNFSKETPLYQEIRNKYVYLNQIRITTPKKHNQSSKKKHEMK